MQTSSTLFVSPIFSFPRFHRTCPVVFARSRSGTENNQAIVHATGIKRQLPSISSTSKPGKVLFGHGQPCSIFKFSTFCKSLPAHWDTNFCCRCGTSSERFSHSEATHSMSVSTTVKCDEYIHQPSNPDHDQVPKMIYTDRYAAVVLLPHSF